MSAPFSTPAAASVDQRDSSALLDRQTSPSTSPLRGFVVFLAPWVSLVLVSDVLSVWGGDPLVSTAGGLFALVFLPGLALAGWLPWDDQRPGLALLALAATACGATWLVLTALALALSGLGLGPPLLVLAGVAALGLPILRIARGSQPLPTASIDSMQLLDVALIMLAAAPLRFVSLGYTEFLSDESSVVLRAMALVQGVPDGLFYHGKGPAEVLVTGSFYTLAGHISEASSRLPFATFNVLAINPPCWLN